MNSLNRDREWEERYIDLRARHIASPLGNSRMITEETNFIKNLLSATESRVRQEIAEKMWKMNYLKWELRKDLVGKYHTINIEKATERAKGWNACLDQVLKIIKER